MVIKRRALGPSSCLQIKVTPYILEAFRNLHRLSPEANIPTLKGTELITVEHLKKYTAARRTCKEKILPWAHELVSHQDSKSVLPCGEGEEEESEAVLKRRAYLLKREEERRYQRLVSNVEHPRAKEAEYIDKRQGSLMHEAGVGLNILVGTVTALFLGWWAGYSYFEEHTKALCVGVLCMGVMLVIETILYMGRLRRLDGAQVQRRRRDARKEKEKAARTAISKDALEAREALHAWLKEQGINQEAQKSSAESS